jgi:putative transposase
MLVVLMSLWIGFRNFWQPSHHLTAKPILRRKAVQPLLRKHAKPAWVAQQVLRLKLAMPKGTGVRKIAAAFNRRQEMGSASKHKACVHISKSYVANILQSQQHALLQLKQAQDKRTPGISRINRSWGIDFTGKLDQTGQPHFIFGMIDHGSRKLLALLVSSKTSEQIAIQLKQAIWQFGKPRSIRTDNESCFTSGQFSQVLSALQIRHQRSQLHCPWQNGRVERLFGTLKQHLHRIHIQNAEQLQSLLDEFKHWYNTIRLHQHLGYQTPQEVWQEQSKTAEKCKASKGQQHRHPEMTWWTGWDGMLSGEQWRC